MLYFRKSPKVGINHAAMINRIVNNKKRKKYEIRYTGHTTARWDKNIMSYFDSKKTKNGYIYVVHKK